MAAKEKNTNGWVKPWLALREKLGAYQALVVQFTNMETDEYIYGNFSLDPQLTRGERG